MWLSSFHLTNSSETSYMDFSWFYRRMGKYYAEEDNRTLRHQFTLETGKCFKELNTFFLLLRSTVNKLFITYHIFLHMRLVDS